jgi:cyclic dehypoxanthinyl futalosine synthase
MSDNDVYDILDKAASGQWVAFDEGLHIYKNASTQDLVKASSKRMVDLWGGKGSARTYLMYYLLNYSNVCAENCTFCNYWEADKAEKAWTYQFEDVESSLEKYYNYGGRVILFQGGNNYAIENFSYYTTFLNKIKERFPEILVFGTSPTEIFFWANKYGMSVHNVIKELKGAGLKAIAGAGAEIAHQPIRDLMFSKKITFEKWLDVMDEACAQGLSSSASLMFGTYDGIDDRFDPEFCRLEHMDLLRERQSKTSHYRAFVAWMYQPNEGKIRTEPASYEEYIRVVCMARLYMRNFPNIQSSYLSLNEQQVGDSLEYAINCIGGVLYTPELVTGSVGAEPNNLSRKKVIDWIENSGYKAEERDYYGRILSDPYTGRSELANQLVEK